jgi:hypothetical protein
LALLPGDTARALNLRIEIVLRTHAEDESQMLRKDKMGTVFFGGEELAKGMAGHVLALRAAIADESVHNIERT